MNSVEQALQAIVDAQHEVIAKMRAEMDAYRNWVEIAFCKPKTRDKRFPDKARDAPEFDRSRDQAWRAARDAVRRAP